MAARITSIHHVTATVADAQEDLDFYAGLLGLRLVKRTVNFDNPAVYHLYYGNERGTPSTIMTTFPSMGWGVPAGARGAGQFTEVTFSAPAGSLELWRERLAEAGAEGRDVETDFGEEALQGSDPSGLRVELVEAKDDPRPPWLSNGMDPGQALRGIHHVTLSVRSPERSADFLTRVLGFEVVREEGFRIRLAAGASQPGRLVDIVGAREAPKGAGGMGTMHHVAFAVPGDEEQLAFRETLLSLGWPVTDVRDRQYFRSIYFPEPGGALIEIATAGPGFDLDEPVADLGETLKLPPWEESNRGTIEAHLPAITLK